MKLRIGHKLLRIRNERQMTQTEFSEFLGLSSSAYNRLERGETQADVDQIKHYADLLNISPYELIPENTLFNNTNHGRGAAVIFGNVTFNYTSDEELNLTQENESLLNQIELLKEQIKLLKRNGDQKPE